MSKGLDQTAMRSTIHRDNIVSKREVDEQNTYTKENRVIHRYREYKEEWNRQSSNIKKKSNSASLSIKKPYSAIDDVNQITNAIS